MDPYYEQRLRDEVIYLHSLWRQGPPRNPNSTFNSAKRKRLKDQRNRKKFKKTQSDSGIPWPCPSPVRNCSPETSFGWPAMKPCSSQATKPVPAEERSRLASLQLQFKAFDAFREFLANNASSDSDEYEEEEEDYWLGGYGSETEEYEFFLRLFVEDSELRSYYEKNYEVGDFCCLVCGALGKKNLGKKFKGGLGLVQHSITVTKTKKKRAHRALGQVICKVLGWDFDRLPTIVLKGEPLSRSLAKTDPNENQGEPEKNVGGNDALSGGGAEIEVADNGSDSELIEKDAYDSDRNGLGEPETSDGCLNDLSAAVTENQGEPEKNVSVNDGLSGGVVGKGVTDNGSDSELVETDAYGSDKNDHGEPETSDGCLKDLSSAVTENEVDVIVSDHVDETVEKGECDNLQSGGVKSVPSEDFVKNDDVFKHPENFDQGVLEIGAIKDEDCVKNDDSFKQPKNFDQGVSEMAINKDEGCMKNDDLFKDLENFDQRVSEMGADIDELPTTISEGTHIGRFTEISDGLKVEVEENYDGQDDDLYLNLNDANFISINDDSDFT